MKLFTAIFFISLIPCLAVAQMRGNEARPIPIQPTFNESQSFQPAPQQSPFQEQRAQTTLSEGRSLQPTLDPLPQPMLSEQLGTQSAPVILASPEAVQQPILTRSATEHDINGHPQAFNPLIRVPIPNYAKASARRALDSLFERKLVVPAP